MNGEIRATRRTLSQVGSFRISCTAFLSFTKFADLLISRQKKMIRPVGHPELVFMGL